MKEFMIRSDGRTHSQIRPIRITHGIVGNADGSVLFELGDTRVICTVTLQEGVPHFLRGTGTGWLTAEYSLLPAATTPRSQREATAQRRNNRSIEISRLLGRALRSIIEFKHCGERTIFVDCDVIQADGSTRVAAISGAYAALVQAAQTWKEKRIITKNIIVEPIAAVSVGWNGQQALLDLNYEEDQSILADFNFVMTGTGKLVEVQGATEQRPIAWEHVDAMHKVAASGIQEVLEYTTVTV
jgi:ribonuclease PH